MERKEQNEFAQVSEEQNKAGVEEMLVIVSKGYTRVFHSCFMGQFPTLHLTSPVISNWDCVTCGRFLERGKARVITFKHSKQMNKN